MPFHYPAENKPAERPKPKLDLEAMISGLLMGLVTLGFAASVLLIMNGEADQWIKRLKTTVTVQRSDQKVTSSTE